MRERLHPRPPRPHRRRPHSPLPRQAHPLLRLSRYGGCFRIGLLAGLEESASNSDLVHLLPYGTDLLRLIFKEGGEDVKEPVRIVYKDVESSKVDSWNFNGNLFQYKEKDVKLDDGLPKKNSSIFGDKGKDDESRNQTDNQTYVPSEEKGQRRPNEKSHSKRSSNELLRSMKDQLILAKAYLNFASPNSNSYLVKELRLRIKENERAIGEATRDSALHKSYLQRMRSMESILSRVGRIYSRCSPLASKLQGTIASTEEQLRIEKSQANYLTQIAARTFPKGFHCLSMRLTADYFSLQPEKRKFVDQKLKQPDLYHYAVFSDNILACAVVVNSTVSLSKEPEKTVFHIVTDALNLPAISMWFLTSPPGKATIEVLSVDDFRPSSANVDPSLTKGHSQDSRFKLPLNYVHFYLPELFPHLNKIVFLDHDVVVQKDLSGLWGLKMNGKVVGVVEMCGDDEHEISQLMDNLLNFSDPLVSKQFNAKACTWEFGLNIFNLKMWRRHALTHVYHKWLQLGRRKQLWKDGNMPLGMVTFYNHTLALDRRWHLRGLGMEESTLTRKDIERAAVLQYDGLMKPWLETGIARYKGYWRKFAPYDHPLLLQCNIHS